MSCLLLAVLLGTTRIPLTPNNVHDPAVVPDRKLPSFDPGLPAVSLEPHLPCFDATGPLKVSVAVVNFSHRGPLEVNWDDILSHVSLTPVGPGRVAARPVGRLGLREQVPAGRTAIRIIDLADHWQVTGGSTYRLDFARALPDGRVHIADPVQFLVEDFAALDRVATRWPDAGDRAAAVTLLRANPLFATWVWRPAWHEMGEEYPPVPWAGPLADALTLWGVGHWPPTGPAVPPALAVGLVERAAVVSGDFTPPFHDRHAAEPPLPAQDVISRLPWSLLSQADCTAVAVRLASARSPRLREQAARLLGSVGQGPDGAAAMVRMADDHDPAIATLALEHIGAHQRDPQVHALLRRKLAYPNGRVAVTAAQKLVYGLPPDPAAFPVLLRLTRHPDPLVRWLAASPLAEERVYRLGPELARATVAERLKVETESHPLESLQRAAERHRDYDRRAEPPSPKR